MKFTTFAFFASLLLLLTFNARAQESSDSESITGSATILPITTTTSFDDFPTPSTSSDGTISETIAITDISTDTSTETALNSTTSTSRTTETTIRTTPSTTKPPTNSTSSTTTSVSSTSSNAAFQTLIRREVLVAGIFTGVLVGLV